ncbi:MAG: hypothetical protein JNL08_09060 [Planctomycetes bacterium]|nr:hypothetical protein [Planctomycetota bacterium]
MSTRSADAAAPPTTAYVLPGRKRPAGDVIVVPPGPGHALEHGARVARTLGGRFLAFAECQQQFLGELRSRLEELDGAIAEDSRARLKGALHGALDVLEWCEAVQVDFAAESGWAAAGCEPLDLAEVCREVAAEPSSHVGEVRVTGHSARPWWGNAMQLAAAIRQGLQVVGERLGGNGFRAVEIGDAEAGPWIRIAGYGEPGDVEAGTVQGFRHAAAAVAARVTPDALGPGAAALVLHLPANRA